jgi:hypothetical protein
MDMTAGAMKFLIEQGIKPSERSIISKSGTEYVVNDQGEANALKPQVFGQANDPIKINTLTGLVEYIKSGIERVNDRLIIQVINEMTVKLQGKLAADGSREVLAISNAIVPHFRFGYFYDTETMNIALQSQFVVNEHSQVLLKVIGNIAENNISEASDDGVSQAVTIKQGVASKVNVKVPNPVELAPYRTFLEVEQPTSKFIFRMKEGPSAAIFEADGGAWRNEAIRNIHEFLYHQLEESITDGHIVIMA